MLVVSTAVIVLAFLLEVKGEDRVCFRGLNAYPLPHTCATWMWFGIRCPGCGLTRGFIHLAQADWAGATRAHRLSGLMAVTVLLQFPYRLVGLWRREKFPIGPLAPRLWGWFLIAALLGNWLIEVIVRYM